MKTTVNHPRPVCVLLAFVLITTMTGCALQGATLNTYLDPGYSRGSITTLAIFPMRNVQLAPSEAQQVNRTMAQGIAQKNEGIEIISPVDAVRLLNEHNLADTWSQFLDTYTSSGIPNANTLSEIGEALGIDAIIQGEVLSLTREDGVYGKTHGQTNVTIRFSMLSVSQGKMIWEASSEGRRKTVTTIEDAPPAIEAINLAIDRIIESLPL